MREEIKGLIDDEFNNVSSSLEDFYDDAVVEDIKNKINFSNYNLQRENYRQELLRICKEKFKDNINIAYSDDMSIEELEKILNDIDN